MLNKSKGDYAYNIIDIDGDADQNVIDKLMSVEGVSMVRVV
jgi:D-3-phosphoglycerate dehydrogenase